MPAKENVHFIRLVPSMDSEFGHWYPYHKAINQTLELLGWRQSLALPNQSTLSPLPENWVKVIDKRPNPPAPKVLYKLYYKHLMRKSFSRFLAQSLSLNERSVIFLEFFNIREMTALIKALALLSRRLLKKTDLWLLYRLDVDLMERGGHAFKTYHRMIEAFLPLNQFKVFTDSEMIQASLAEFFSQDVHVLSTPSGNLWERPINPLGEKMTVWVHQGHFQAQDRILDLLCHTSSHRDVEFLVRGIELNTELRANPQITLLSKQLPMEEFVQWQQKANVYLFACNVNRYKGAISGIFVDAVCAGKLPFAPEGTWMAYELRKHNLDECVIDFERGTFMSEIVEHFYSSEVREKLQKMAAAYREYHSPSGFAKLVNSHLMIDD